MNMTTWTTVKAYPDSPYDSAPLPGAKLGCDPALPPDPGEGWVGSCILWRIQELGVGLEKGHVGLVAGTRGVDGGEIGLHFPFSSLPDLHSSAYPAAPQPQFRTHRHLQLTQPRPPSPGSR